jgi:hypothetical protein
MTDDEKFLWKKMKLLDLRKDSQTPCIFISASNEQTFKKTVTDKVGRAGEAQPGH